MDPRDLNRTLLLRQDLLARTSGSATAMVRHLVGLQAQDPLPPYLGLAARLDGFDPLELSADLEHARLVRLTAMRGTLHVLDPDDASTLRTWVQPALTRASAGNRLTRPARDVPVHEVTAVADRLLAEAPRTVGALGTGLADAFPGIPGAALVHVARDHLALVQLPPRGLWKRSGGVAYQTLARHLVEHVDGHPPDRLAGPEPDVRELVRRYLRAFGPATPADLTTWSRVTRLGPVVAAMRDELVTVRCADGSTLYDVPDAPYASGDTVAPVRLLGCYDNLWLSHADQGRAADPGARARWSGVNGGVAHTVLVDGFLAGLWRVRGDRVQVEELPALTRGQRADLDDEISRVEAVLAR